MATKTEIQKICVKNFINQLNGFLDDVLIIIPGNEGILSAKKYVSTLSSINPKLLLKLWYESVTLKYAEQIQNGDLDFALNKDYSDDVLSKNEDNDENAKSIMVIIDNLKQATQNLEKEEQKTIIKYLQNITQLTQLYNQ